MRRVASAIREYLPLFVILVLFRHVVVGDTWLRSVAAAFFALGVMLSCRWVFIELWRASRES